MPYNTRLDHLIAARNLATVVDVVSITPTDVIEVAGTGIMSVRALAKDIRQYLGESWEEAHLRVSNRAFTRKDRRLLGLSLGPRAQKWTRARWASLESAVEALPSEVKTMPVEDALDWREVKSVCRAVNVTTIANLPGLSRVERPGQELRRFAETALLQVSADPLAHDATWRQHYDHTLLPRVDVGLRRAVREMVDDKMVSDTANERRVTRQRAQGERTTALRAMQHGLWRGFVIARLHRVLSPGESISLQLLSRREPFFATNGDERVFRFYVNRLLNDDVWIVDATATRHECDDNSA